MTTDDVRHLLHEHACWVDGTRYTFDLEWVAIEKDLDLAQARVLLRVSAAPDLAGKISNSPVPAPDLQRADVLTLLANALHQHLAEPYSSRRRARVSQAPFSASVSLPAD